MSFLGSYCIPFLLLYRFVLAERNQIMYILFKGEIKAYLKSAVKILNVKQVSFVLQSSAGLILSLGRFHFHSTSLRFLSNFKGGCFNSQTFIPSSSNLKYCRYL